MKKEKQLNFYIGLKQQDMTTDINKDYAISIIRRGLENIGAKGFNIPELKGFWEGLPEDALKVSFINTFNIDPTAIKWFCEYLKTELNQESILFIEEEVLFNLF